MNKSSFVLPTICFCFLCSILSSQNIFYAKAGNVNPLQDGKNWNTAFASLQQALENAHYGDQIWVASGLYKPTEGLDRHQSFNLKNGVKVYGGFSGDETSLSQRNWEVYQSILSGNIGSPDREDNVFHVVFGRGLDSTTVLDGFTVTGGYSLDVPPSNLIDAHGGGILLLGDVTVSNSKPQIHNCHITQNMAQYGGGICIRWEDPNRPELGKHFVNPVITNCRVTRNYAYFDGGGLLKVGPMPPQDTFALRHCELLDNRAQWGGGGGIRLTEAGYSTLLWEDCLFERDSSIDGGGIFLTNDPKGEHPLVLILKNTQFNRNFAVEGSGFYYNGNWILLNTGKVSLQCTIDHCTFEANKTLSGKGCLFIYQSESGSINIKMSHTKFLHNRTQTATSQVDIGSLGQNQTNVEISDCVFIDNARTSGSGFTTAISLRYAAQCKGYHLFKNCVFKDNAAGIAVLTRSNAKMKTDITNCTFFNNGQYILTKSWYSEFLDSDTVFNKMTVNNCIIEEPRSDWMRMFYGNDPDDLSLFDFRFNHCMVSLKEIPLLANADVALANNVLMGIDPQFVDIVADDLRVEPCSPAIGAGLNKYATNVGLTTDLNGAPRILFANVDLGAYEHPDSCGVSGLPIDFFSAANKLDISPNPSSTGRLNITIPEQVSLATSNLCVVDLNGKTVASFPLTRESTRDFDLAFLPKGIYLIKVQTPNLVYSGKWIRV